jgi:glycerol uptake facilitator-like aquaporin
LPAGTIAIALLANSIATGGVLVAIVTAFGAVSGAHFNPVVSCVSGALREKPWSEVALYVVAQLAGAFAGVAVAHAMFDKPLYFASEHVRSTHSEIFSEAVATFGLITVILGTARRKPDAVPYVVGGYITAAYWFTHSTSFANPAVTLARAASDTFAGIRPSDAPAFIAAQFVGAALAFALMQWLVTGRKKGRAS